MAENIRLEIVTPEKEVVNEEVKIVMAPGVKGEFGVLSGHVPFLSILKTGMLRYKDVSGKERAVFVSGGFAETLSDKVTILTESAERRKDIDVSRAKEALSRAQDRISGGHGIDVDRAKAAVHRAMERIRIAE